MLDQRKIKDHYEEESMDYSQLSAYPERSQKLKRFIPVNKLDKSTSLQALSVMAGSPIGHLQMASERSEIDVFEESEYCSLPEQDEGGLI